MSSCLLPSVKRGRGGKDTGFTRLGTARRGFSSEGSNPIHAVPTQGSVKFPSLAVALPSLPRPLTCPSSPNPPTNPLSSTPTPPTTLRYVEGIRTSADAAAREQLARVVEALVGERVTDFNGCIRWARFKFQDYFHDR